MMSAISALASGGAFNLMKTVASKGISALSLLADYLPDRFTTTPKSTEIIKSSAGYNVWNALNQTCESLPQTPCCVCDSNDPVKSVVCLINKFGVNLEAGGFERCIMVLQSLPEKGMSCLHQRLQTIMPPPEHLPYSATEYQQAPNIIRELPPPNPDYMAEHPRNTATWVIVTITILSAMTTILLFSLLARQFGQWANGMLNRRNRQSTDQAQRLERMELSLAALTQRHPNNVATGELVYQTITNQRIQAGNLGQSVINLNSQPNPAPVHRRLKKQRPRSIAAQPALDVPEDIYTPIIHKHLPLLHGGKDSIATRPLPVPQPYTKNTIVENSEDEDYN